MYIANSFQYLTHIRKTEALRHWECFWEPSRSTSCPILPPAGENAQTSFSQSPRKKMATLLSKAYKRVLVIVRSASDPSWGEWQVYSTACRFWIPLCYLATSSSHKIGTKRFIRIALVTINGGTYIDTWSIFTNQSYKKRALHVEPHFCMSTRDTRMKSNKIPLEILEREFCWKLSPVVRTMIFVQLMFVASSMV